MQNHMGKPNNKSHAQTGNNEASNWHKDTYLMWTSNNYKVSGMAVPLSYNCQFKYVRIMESKGATKTRGKLWQITVNLLIWQGLN